MDEITRGILVLCGVYFLVTGRWPEFHDPKMMQAIRDCYQMDDSE